MDFLQVDSHLYLYYLQSIYRRQILTAKIYFPKAYAFHYSIIYIILVNQILSFDKQNRTLIRTFFAFYRGFVPSSAGVQAIGLHNII